MPALFQFDDTLSFVLRAWFARIGQGQLTSSSPWAPRFTCSTSLTCYMALLVIWSSWMLCQVLVCLERITRERRIVRMAELYMMTIRMKKEWKLLGLSICWKINLSSSDIFGRKWCIKLLRASQKRSHYYYLSDDFREERPSNWSTVVGVLNIEVTHYFAVVATLSYREV